MLIKEYDFLHDDAKIIRTEVFIEEQGFKIEFDDIDNTAVHLVMYDNLVPVATCRLFFDNVKNSFMVGRIAVSRQYRGKQLGAQILSGAEDTIKRLGGNCVMLSAQMRAKGFYQKQGYSEFGETYLDEDCLHIMMKKNIG